MVWPLIAMAGMALLQGQQQQNAAYKDNAATNKAIMEANQKNWDRTMYNVGLMNVQRGQKLRSLVQQQADVGVQELQAIGEVQANAAASGTTGASVRQVELDAQRQFERARALILEENEADAFNFNTQLEVTLRNARDSLGQAQKYTGPSNTDILVGAAVSAAGTYAQSRFQLGLSSRQVAPATSASPQVVQGASFKG